MTQERGATAGATGLAGLRVVALESRMAGPMADLIAKHGGLAIEAPSMREVPIEENPAAGAFGNRLVAGDFDVVIFLTGVGTRFLAQTIEAAILRADWVGALGRTTVVARGPKPVAALRELGARVDVAVPEPNTWRELVATLDAARPVAGLRVAVQEYGLPNPDLVAALEERGATVTRVPVYRWALPIDTGPLRAAVAELADGRAGAVLFTSAQQIEHLFMIADEEGRADDLREALGRKVVVGSIGPTTSEALRTRGLPVDVEPEHPKMGHLVAALADGWRAVVKPRARIEGVGRLSVAHPTDDRLHQSRFMRACRREPVDATPIWLMRQAGRYMAEYREVRAKVGFLDLCSRPELACEVTVTAAEKLGVDAAILFADILLILRPLGLDLEFAKGEGPVIHNPLRIAADVDRVRPLESMDALAYVPEAVRLIRRALDPGTPLIGFAGAPFTLACYAIEGGSSRHYERAKAFMMADSGAWDALMTKLVDATILYLSAQAEAGAQALQLFDSWVGCLAPEDYRRSVLPHMKRLFAGLPAGVPTIHFGTGTSTLLELQREAGGDVIGLDWRVELGPTWDRLGPDVAVQGNLDPVVLLGPREAIARRTRRILDQAAGRPGHIFNLGHGILQTTPVDNARYLIDLVHEHRAVTSAPEFSPSPPGGGSAQPG